MKHHKTKGREIKLVMPEPLTDEKKRQINRIVKNAYEWANERLPFKLRFYPPYRGVKPSKERKYDSLSQT